MSRARIVAFFVALASLLVFARPAWAHKPSDAYLALKVQGTNVDARLDLALRDLDHVIGLDVDGDGTITWGNVQARKDAIEAYALPRLKLKSGDAACNAPSTAQLSIVDHSDGSYAVLTFVIVCPTAPEILGIDYTMFFDADPQHRGIVKLDDGTQTKAAIFATTSRSQTFDKAHSRPLTQLASAIKDGIRHIFEGIDHLLFLIALLLPSVIRRDESGKWQPVPSFKVALVDVLKIVTAFTLAHSITLSLSALGVLRLPSRFVESAIAASVVLAAVNNLWPLLKDDRWQAAFALGLLHGFGFSATLMDAGLPRDNLLATLFGFNVGVEIGQACVVAVFLPIAFALRKTRAYRVVGLSIGSIAITIVATVWFVERAFAHPLFARFWSAFTKS